MQKSEWLEVVKLLRDAYPKNGFLPGHDSVETWFKLLKDIPGEDMKRAAIEYATTKTFPPSIAELRELALYREGTGWDQAWESVQTAIRRYGQYREKDALDSLEPDTRSVVERIGFLNLCLSENPTADRANFRMMYEIQEKRTRTEAVDPLIGAGERWLIGNERG